MTKVIWLSFSPSEARLKNPKAELRRSRSLAFWICEASEASVHKLTKAWGCFEGSRQCILSREKTTPWQIPNETVWPRKLLPTKVTKHFCPWTKLFCSWREGQSITNFDCLLKNLHNRFYNSYHEEEKKIQATFLAWRVVCFLLPSAWSWEDLLLTLH